MSYNSAQILDDLRGGKIDRRSALKQLMLCGLTASGAYAALGELGDASAHAKAVRVRADEKEIRKQFDQLRRIISTKPVMDALREMDQTQAEAEKRRIAGDLIKTVTDKKYYSQLGIPYEPEMRAALRVFEPAKEVVGGISILDQKIPRDFTVNPLGTLCASLGYIACVSYGKQL